MANFLITGANGFVGSALCADLVQHQHTVRAAIRSDSAWMAGLDNAVVGELNADTDWSVALQNIDVVVHLAARVHVMHDTVADPLTEFRKVNVSATENLACSSAAAGVKRLVYVSSIKVNGEETIGGHAYTELDTPSPQDFYGISKWEAEQALWRVAEQTRLEVVVVRPPLVYGTDVKGNFVQMLKMLDKGIPLPLASVENSRSLLYVGNLADALIVCATHPAAAGQTFLVSDAEEISTAALLRSLGEGMGRPARLLLCPPSLLKLAARLIGKSAQVERLLGSLQVDSGKIRRDLNWTPPYTLPQGLQATAAWYRNAHL